MQIKPGIYAELGPKGYKLNVIVRVSRQGDLLFGPYKLPGHAGMLANGTTEELLREMRDAVLQEAVWHQGTRYEWRQPQALYKASRAPFAVTVQQLTEMMVNDKVSTMNIDHSQRNNLFANNPRFRLVECVFSPFTGQKHYHYKTLDTSIEPGDYCVVDTPSNGLAVVKVVDITDDFTLMKDDVLYKWVVSKVNTSEYDKIQEQENGALKTLKVAAARERQAQLRMNMPIEATEALDAIDRL